MWKIDIQSVKKWGLSAKSGWQIGATALVLTWIHLLTQNDYLLFHCLVEIFAVVVAWSIFIFALNTRKFMKNGYFPLLGIGFLFVGVGDLLHALAYPGMGVFPGSSNPNLSTQLWIASRFIQAASFGVAAFFLRRKARTLPAFVGFAAGATALLLSIFQWEIFPVCYLSGSGLTAFKIGSESVICIILIAACGHLYINRSALHAHVFRWLICSILLTIVSEIAFSFYSNPLGLLNLSGHVLKAIAFIAAYKAIIEKGLVKPHDLIFHDLQKREQALSIAHNHAEWLARFPNENPGPVLRASFDGNVLYCNSAAAGLQEGWECKVMEPLPEKMRLLVLRAVACKQGMTEEIELAGKTYRVAVALFPESKYANLYCSDITAHKITESREREALRVASVSQAASDILNAMGEGVLLLDMRGQVVSVNPAMIRMTGISATNVLGHPVFHLLPQLLSQSDQAIAESALFKAMQGYLPKLPPLTVLSKTGRSVPVIPTVAFVRDPYNRQPTQIVITLLDLSELRAIERSLYETNAVLERVFDNTHMALAYLDRDLNFIRVNRSYAEAYQHEPDFFPGKNPFDLYPHPENEALFHKVIETGEPCVIEEKPFAFPDNPEWGITYWDWTLRPLLGEKHRVETLLFCLVDVTERVEAQQKLIVNEQKYRELIESANSVILRVNPNQRITFCNEYALRFFGYSADEMLGKSVFETIVPKTDSKGRSVCEMDRTIASTPAVYSSQDSENICKDGRRVWIHWSNRAILDTDGHVKEILCVGNDITKRKQLEKETELYRQRLRTLAGRLASNEEIERRRVSSQIHDTVIQTLSLINIRLGGIRTAVKSAGLEEQLEKIDKIRNLLGTGIGECRSLMATLTPPLLYEIGLGAALKDFAITQGRLYGDVITVEEEEGLDCLSDESLGFLFQAARELVINAMKHAGGGEIFISLACINNRFRVQVRDTGVGFNPDTVDEQHMANFETGGFGLFSLRERMQSLGGQLDIESTPGKGAIITISLPASSDA